ncbi:integrase core domain-containing protein [Solirubrobacter ginsenosidimutans]|uniref:integrase core domain-containing protein n=1 Tax=Solirubrobacter ginsenosidimutans TaxID=490573 RepID=UPI0035567FE8
MDAIASPARRCAKVSASCPRKTLSDVEPATLEWVDWFNTCRLHSACGRLSPAQYEQHVSTIF